MKNPLEILKDLRRVILNAEVELVERTDADGKLYTAEAFEVGYVLYIDGVAASAGSYSFPDGESIETDDAGVIVQISKPDEAPVEEAEVEAEVPAEASVEASETPATEPEVEAVPEPEPTPEVSLSEVEGLIDTKLEAMETSLVGVISDLIKDLNTKIEKKVKQVELSATDQVGSQVEQPTPEKSALNAQQRKLNQFLVRTQIN